MLKNKLCASLLTVCAMMAVSANAEAVSICIDAGHGGSDPGALGCNLRESEITLSVAKKLETLLKAAGYDVFMTRTTDTDVSLSQRSSYANSKGTTTFASIHVNSASVVATGIETYCYTNNLSKSSGTQAKNIQNKMLAVWPLANRGAKEADFHVVRETNMPATLTEIGFINNCDKDATYLKSDAHRNNAAKAHCEALVSQWGGKASGCSGSGGGTPSTPTTETGSVKGYVFEGATLDTSFPKVDGATYKCGSVSLTSSSSAISSFTLPVGSYTCTASKTGYTTNSRSDCSPVTAGGTSWCSINIPKATAEAPKNGTATGSVKDSVTSSKIAATVSVSGGESKKYDGTTDWSFSLAAGSYTIKASATGYDDNSITCKVTSDKSTSCPISLVPKKATIKGNISDAESGAKVAGTVALGSNTVTYDAINDWSFTVAAGDYTVTATVNGYKTGSTKCSAAKGETKTCNIKVEKATSDTAKPGMLRGTLTDSETGVPLTGTIELDNGDVSYYNGVGSWQFYLQPNTYKVTGSAEGYTSATVTCGVTSEAETQCPVTLKANKVKTSGKVYDNSTQTNVPATVTIKSTNGTTIDTISYDGTTDWSKELAPGNYQISAIADGYQETLSSCIVKPGKEASCPTAIIKEGTATGTMTGIVYDARSEVYLISATIAIEGGSTVSYTPYSADCENDLCKTWVSDKMPTGTYTVTASAPGYYTNSVSCQALSEEAGASLCKIALTATEDADNLANIETGATPTIMIIPEESSCSANTRLSKHSAPFGIFALITALGSALALRRRKNNQGE